MSLINSVIICLFALLLIYVAFQTIVEDKADKNDNDGLNKMFNSDKENYDQAKAVTQSLRRNVLRSIILNSIVFSQDEESNDTTNSSLTDSKYLELIMDDTWSR